MGDGGIVDWLRCRQETLDKIERDCDPGFRHQAFESQPRARFGEAADCIESLEAENTRLREALEGMLMEWDKFTQYGSPIAKSANERIAAAREALDAE